MYYYSWLVIDFIRIYIMILILTFSPLQFPCKASSTLLCMAGPGRTSFKLSTQTMDSRVHRLSTHQITRCLPQIHSSKSVTINAAGLVRVVQVWHTAQMHFPSLTVQKRLKSRTWFQRETPDIWILCQSPVIVMTSLAEPSQWLWWWLKDQFIVIQ